MADKPAYEAAAEYGDVRTQVRLAGDQTVTVVHAHQSTHGGAACGHVSGQPGTGQGTLIEANQTAGAVHFVITYIERVSRATGHGAGNQVPDQTADVFHVRRHEHRT